MFKPLQPTLIPDVFPSEIEYAIRMTYYPLGLYLIRGVKNKSD